jgi:hypothetical protein
MLSFFTLFEPLRNSQPSLEKLNSRVEFDAVGMMPCDYCRRGKPVDGNMPGLPQARSRSGLIEFFKASRGACAARNCTLSR